MGRIVAAMHDLETLRDRLRDFTAARDWGRFHTPKNLAMALAGEVGELVAELQWLSDDELAAGVDDDLRWRLADESADILLYLVLFTDRAGIDLLASAAAKIERNEERYPADQVRGSAAKAGSAPDPRGTVDREAR
jgi:NTP pyrophosphatase (non-canonical NTP hydrolase)